jgi:phosphotransferase family enzyme
VVQGVPAPACIRARGARVAARRRADLLPRVFAADAERSWLLLDDAGDRLGELESTPGQLERWAHAVARYAELQRVAAPDADAFVSSGATDRRGPLLLEQFAELLEHEVGLEPGESAQLRALLRSLQEDVELLAGLGVPDTIQHDDLHDGNIFLRDGEFRIMDWGDSCVAHPFHILDAYVDASGAPVTDDYVDAARRLGYVSGTLKWWETLQLVADPTRPPFDDAMPLRLRRLIELCA